MKFYDVIFALASIFGLYVIGLNKYGIECLISGILIGFYVTWRYKNENT